MVMNMMEWSSLNLYDLIHLSFFKKEYSSLINGLTCYFLCSFIQNLIDLAGSESSKTETTGLRRKEGSYINKSLLTLGTVGALYKHFIDECLLLSPMLNTCSLLYGQNIQSLVEYVPSTTLQDYTLLSWWREGIES